MARMIEDLKIVTMDLSLRDLFAGQIIAALINNRDHAGMDWDTIAENAYGYADGMLKARNKKGGI
jgi:hypothetical protein